MEYIFGIHEHKGIIETLKYLPLHQGHFIAMVNASSSLDSYLNTPHNWDYHLKKDLFFWNALYFFVIPCCHNSLSNLSNHSSNFLGVKPLVDSNIYLVSCKNSSSNYSPSFSEFYYVENISTLQTISLPDKALQLRSKGNMEALAYRLNPKVSRRKFLEVNLTATAGYELDYLLETKFGDESNSTFDSGMAVSMYRDMGFYLNFREASIPGRWMVDNVSDSIDTVVLRDAAVIAISQSTLTIDNRNVTTDLLTFLQPTTSFRLYAILLQPPSRTIRNMVTMPFAVSMWSAYFSALILLSLMMVVMMFLMRGLLVENMESASPTLSSIFGESVFTMLAIAGLQGYELRHGLTEFRRTFSYKMLILTGYVTGTVTCIGYSANIISMQSKEIVPIRSAEDVKKRSLPIYGDSDYAEHPYLYEGLLEFTNSDPFITPTQALTMLQKPKSVFIFLGFQDAYTASSRIMGISEKFMCDRFSHIPFSRIEYKSSMFLKKGSPYREFFNFRIIAGKESGLFHRYFLHYTNEAIIQCSGAHGTINKPLEVQDILIPFLVSMTGAVLALVIMILERLQTRTII